jgi:hypothetical protein
MRQALDATNISNLIRSRKRNSATFFPCAPCAPDAVHVIGGIIGKIVVDDDFDTGNVDAACGDIGGDKDTINAGFESLQRGFTLCKRTIRVDFGCGVPHGHE